MVKSTFITIIKKSQCTAAWIIHQFSRKNVIRELVEAGSHQLLFLPKYSPNLNDIEHDFSALKRARMYPDINTSLDAIILNYYTK
jgi:putative transposase